MVGVLVLAGCPAKQVPQRPVAQLAADAPETQSAAVEIRSGIWRYTTRGIIENLPAKRGVARDLAIHHEPLVAFYSKDGTNVGMKAMVMDFPSIAPDVSLEGLAVGDVVVFDFVVDWKSRDVWTVTRLAKLPKDTPLNFQVPAPAPGPGPDK
jgi:Copper binding periplasmic protein CusF